MGEIDRKFAAGTVMARCEQEFVKAQAEGENGTGRYIRFAVRQDNPETGLDFIVVRVYDDEQKEILATLKDKDPVHVEGTLRSSRGSGVNYVRCVKIGQ